MPLRYLLDTNACIAFLDGADVRLRDRWLKTPSEDLALCSVVKTELFRGAWACRDPQGVLARLDQFFAPFKCLSFDDRCAERCGQIIAQLDRRGSPIGLADCMIAATAMADDLTVVTRNQRHFRRVKGLKVVGW